MIESFIKLLESFKQNRISKILEQIDTKCFEILYSKHVSSRIARYFPRYEVCFLSEDTVLEPGKIYVKEQQGKITYSVIDTTGVTIQEVLLEDIEVPSPFSAEALNALNAWILSATAKKGHIQWAPFTDYSLDPDNISQIKKLINALYYARLTFIDLETVNLRENRRDLKLLFKKTVDLGYEASFLLTHLDVDLKDMFQEELDILLPLLSRIQSAAENHALKKETIVKALHPEVFAYKTGEVAGITIDQMRPLGGDVDYNFLTQFSALLPNYIDQLTHYIQQYSSQIQESEPKLNKQKLDELQHAALSLLNDIENLKGNRFFISLKFLNYIYIIQNIITLSMSTFEQIGELSESSQDLVRDKLAQLKYTILPTLFGLVDKIEDNAMLKPGTLSVPLMQKVKVFYDTLLYLPKKAIDFKTKGEELLTIEDSRFTELRLKRAYTRINKANKALYKIQKAYQAWEHFFTILKNPTFKEFRLYQFSPEVKKELIEHYKLLKPYMIKLDSDFNEFIIEKLKGPEKEPWSSYLRKPLRWAKKKIPEDHISFILEKQKALHDLMTKEENTQLFHIGLNKDLIVSVHEKIDLRLFPYNDKTSVYSLDESIPLQLELDREKQFKLTKEEFQNIQHAYNEFAQIIKTQLTSQPKVYEINLDLNHLEPEIKTKCHKKYIIFQPYLSLIIPIKLKDSAQSMERYLTELFTNKPITNLFHRDLFLEIDESINNFFDFINFEWMDSSEFQVLLNAYTRFSITIKKQIEQKPQFYESNLLLTHLDSDVKEECYSLYKIFQPYIKFVTSPELKSSVKTFEKYLPALLTNEPFDILEAPTTVSFLKLDKNILNFLRQWEDKSETYYDILKGKFINTQESALLHKKREEDAKLHFKNIEGDKRLQNSEQINADQALELCQWYKNKHSKFLIAYNAYLQFMDLIKEEIHTNPLISESIFLLEGLDTPIKKQCRHLYNIFQPYLINAFPSELRETALKFDYYLVDLLSDIKIETTDTSSTDGSSIKILFDLEEYLHEHFARTDIEWKRRSQSYQELADQKFIQENESTELSQNTNTARIHYVIQHTHYSKCIHEFRKALFEVTSLFNKAMQHELTPQSLGIPFPEMEDDNRRLSQSKQVCALKDIYNSMYHLEGIAIELEKLNNKSLKTIYVYYLIKAYGHVNEIIKLSKRLVADPYLNFIAQEVLDKAQALYAVFQEHSDAYQSGPEQVSYGPPTVRTNSLWYVLNAFYVSPKHIRALQNNNYLTTNELNELHLRAKKATLFIEGLIQNSDSYFKLFLQTPKMIYLYQELTTKLNEFTSTTHDTAVNNLDKLRSTLFTPMLLEADRWENRLGLVPGHLSGTLRQITDEFYKGLLHSLDLNSQTHIALVCDKKPLEQRIEQTKKNIHYAKKHLKKLAKEHLHINYLYENIEKHRKLTNGFLKEEQIKQIESELLDTYKKALPKLTKLKLEKKVIIEPSQYAEDHQFDDLCNSRLKEYDPHFSEVEALIKASHHYYLGLKATCQMRLQTAEEKLDYLNQLIEIQEVEILAFIEKYTTESFDKHLASLCNRQIGLQYMDKEYQRKLREYLVNFKSELIDTSKISIDINLKLNALLKEKISIFEKKNYAEYYHLDSVRVALAQFKIYFSYSIVAIQNNNSLFESEKSLNEKTERINTLDAIAENKELSINERIEQIKTQIKDPNFSRIILGHKQVDTFSFAYLKLCFLSLLEALHLYTPSRKKFLNHINEAVNNPPEISQLTKRFGLFTAIKAKDKNHLPSQSDPTQNLPELHQLAPIN